MRFAFEANAMPQLKVEQPPDAVIVVAMPCPVLVEQFLDGFAAKISAIEAARFEQHGANHFQSRSGQLDAPRSWKAKFRTIKDRVRKEVFHGFFQDPLSSH